MKTFAEVAAWHAGALEQFGDPAAPVCQIFVRWQEGLDGADRGEDVVVGPIDGGLRLVLGPRSSLPVRIKSGEPQISDEYELSAFGAELVVDGVWALTPSLNVEGVIHAFLVVYGVPDPAPWETWILLPT